jgi:hypothetical protein
MAPPKLAYNVAFIQMRFGTVSKDGLELLTINEIGPTKPVLAVFFRIKARQ